MLFRLFRPAAAGLALFLAVPVSAQSTTGFFVSPRVYAVGVSVDENTDESDGGGGLGLRLGYGFTKTVSVYAAFEGASVDSGEEDLFGVDEDYALGSLDLGAQFNLLPSSSVNPFLRVALNGTTARFDVDNVDSDDDPELRGGGLTLGAGAEFRLSRTLALEAALDVSGGAITEFEAFDVTFEGDGDDPYGTGRLGVGLVWRP